MFRKLQGRQGFTLVELMLVVAIVGLLAAIAIPNFLKFRLRAKTAEARTNLGAIRTSEVAYFSEWNLFVADQPPVPVNNRAGDDRKMTWDYDTRFSILGFAAERAVFYSYSLESGVGGVVFVSRPDGLTMSAVGDLDADGSIASFTLNDSSNEILRGGDIY